MFKVIIPVLISVTTLFASLLDFRTLDQAKELYEQGDYSGAQQGYEKIADKNDELRFNLGDSYYKQKKYKEALSQYEKIRSKELRAKALHNMGNSYANLKQIDKAINSYEEALKLNDDEDTAYNLELLKKIKDQQKKKNNQKKKDQKKENKKQKEDQKKKGQEKEKDDKKEGKKKENKEKQKKKNKEKNGEKKGNKEPKKAKLDRKKAMNQKELRKLMKKMGNKKMPTLMYQATEGKKAKRSKDVNPW